MIPARWSPHCAARRPSTSRPLSTPSRHTRNTYLLGLLQEVGSDPRGYLARTEEENLEVLYAVVLLAHFREPAAHDLVLRLARLPGEDFERLLGHFITDDFDGVLLTTSDGQLLGIRALLLERR